MEELTLNVIREPGCGLGMSIAGGIGSTAYVGDDLVRCPRFPLIPPMADFRSAESVKILGVIVVSDELRRKF